MSGSLSEPAKLLLLCSLLTKDHIVTANGKAFLKELVLRRDPRLASLLQTFESKQGADARFMEDLHQLIADESKLLFDELFSDTSLEVGKTLSKSQREQLNLSEEKSLIYGEVDYPSFYRILRKISPSAGGVFYDLGSGTGKALFAARLTQDFSRCTGIEILSNLHSRADMIVERYNSQYRRQFMTFGRRQRAQVFNGSLATFDWSDGDVVFANSTCFDDDLMTALSDRATLLKPGAFVITFTKGLNCPRGIFEVLERKRYRMSWGPATVFIHRRLNKDGNPVGPSNLNIFPSDNIEYEDPDLDNDDDDDDDNDDDDDDDDNYEEDENTNSHDEEEEDDDDDDVDVSYGASPERDVRDELEMNSPMDSALLERKMRASHH